MVDLQTIGQTSRKPEQFRMVTEEIHKVVEDSPVKNDLVLVVTVHTTTGIMINEGSPYVGMDIGDTLTRTVSLEADYAHVHFLPSYGATDDSSTGHIKSLIYGSHYTFPAVDGKIVCDGAQDIYLVELGDPQTRRAYVEVFGDV